jgi:cysteine-rich repeat protein
MTTSIPHRFRHPLATLLGLLSLLALPGCPTPTGDDDSAGDDDASADDDDSTAPPPCNAEDVSGAADGEPVYGSTSESQDGWFGSCSNPAVPVPDDLLAFTSPFTATWIFSTEDAATDFDTVLFAFSDCKDPEGTELACNDDIVPMANLSSRIEVEMEGGAQIFLVVEGYEASGNYGLSITSQVCGDGNVSGSETCDDNNTTPGDGCDADCHWECNDDANEDDDTLDSMTAVDTFPASFPDQVLCPTDIGEEFPDVYVDLFTVELAAGEYIDARTSGGATMTTDCAEQTLFLGIYDLAVNGIAFDDTSDGDCAHAVAEPGAGTYIVAVYGVDPLVPPQDYALEIQVGVSECGNDELEGIEECDDGDLEGGDGCTATCVLEDAECPLEGDPLGPSETAIEGTSTGGASWHEPSCSLAGGFDVVYEVTVDHDTTLVASLLDGADWDTVLYVRSDCLGPDSELACQDDYNNGESLQSVVFWDLVANTPYYLIVDGYGPDSFGDFALTIYEPVCGDGTVDPNEACDDNNPVDGDGCESDCSETPACALPLDADLLVVEPGTPASVTVDLAAADDNLPALSCSPAGGNDAVVNFALDEPADVSIAFDHTGGDVQYALLADDGTCSVAVECLDPFPDVTGTITAALGAGYYRLVFESYGTDTPTVPVSITVSATAP